VFSCLETKTGVWRQEHGVGGKSELGVGWQTDMSQN